MKEAPASEFESFMSPRFGTYVAAYLTRQGVDPTPLFKAAGIPYAADQEFVTPITPTKLCALLETAAAHMGDPYIGLSIGKQFSFEFSGLNALIMISSANMEQAMRARIKYDTYINNAIYDRIQATHKYFVHGFRVSTIENVNLRHIHDLLAAQLLTVLRIGTGRDGSPVKMNFVHPAPKDRKIYHEHFNTEQIEFESAINSMAYDNDTARLPFVTANRTLNNLLTRSVQLLLSDDEGNHFTDSVYREVIRLLEAGDSSLESVASNLYVSTRTLRRKLKEEGVSFQQVKQRAMHKLAIQWLTMSNASLSDIAFQLGYSESSAFVRAFRSWEGETPQRYRDRVAS